MISLRVALRCSLKRGRWHASTPLVTTLTQSVRALSSPVSIDMYEAPKESPWKKEDLGTFDAKKFKELTHFFRENALSDTQKGVKEAYSEGDYKSALVGARVFREQCEIHFSKEHPVYASALNNLALMYKQNGEHEKSVKTYIEALHIYRDVFKGEDHVHYATTLFNLGMGYRLQAEGTKGMEKLHLQEQAKMAFERVVELRLELLGEGHADLAIARNNLAMARAALGEKAADIEESLTKSVETLKTLLGPDHLIVATAENNLGLYLKSVGRHSEALVHYRRAMHVRTDNLGLIHPDSVISRHNLANCLEAMGRENEATALREEILDALGVTDEDDESDIEEETEDAHDAYERELEQRKKELSLNKVPEEKVLDAVGEEVNSTKVQSGVSKTGRPTRRKT